MHIDVDEPDARNLFWEGMRDVADAAARHQDQALYQAIVKIGRAALAQGVELVPSGGLFLQCPICDALPGQLCINVAGHPLGDRECHPERVELAAKTLSGEAPLPPPLR
ncbi:zinc finger domain-containing protein [Micromonospora palythoicola]|uniref:zinc finger domain-containing protein n=1 Tax=Micromonospora palythoicola TaxID=3120507 RepID=UPI002FCE30B7